MQLLLCSKNMATNEFNICGFYFLSYVVLYMCIYYYLGGNEMIKFVKPVIQPVVSKINYEKVGKVLKTINQYASTAAKTLTSIAKAAKSIDTTLEKLCKECAE